MTNKAPVDIPSVSVRACKGFCGTDSPGSRSEVCVLNIVVDTDIVFYEMELFFNNNQINSKASLG